MALAEDRLGTDDKDVIVEHVRGGGSGTDIGNRLSELSVRDGMLVMSPGEFPTAALPSDGAVRAPVAMQL